MSGAIHYPHYLNDNVQFSLVDVWTILYKPIKLYGSFELPPPHSAIDQRNIIKRNQFLDFRDIYRHCN